MPWVITAGCWSGAAPEPAPPAPERVARGQPEKVCGPGRTVQNLDGFELIPPASASAAAVLATGREIYVAGHALRGASMAWVVRRASSGAPGHWATVDLVQGGQAQASALAGSERRIWAAGTLRQGGVTHWVVRERSKKGAWAEVDRYAGAVPRDAAVDGAGRVFVAGEISGTGAAPGRGLTRRRNPDGTWSTVDVFGDARGPTTAAAAIAAGPSTVFVVGNAGGRRSRWILRKSQDGGSTWTTVSMAKSQQTATDLVVADETGEIYLVGYESVGKSSSAWMLLRSSNGGETWASFISERPRGGRLTAAHAVVVDPAGGVFVGGSVEQDGGARWVLRRAPRGAKKLERVDDYRHARSGLSADKVDDLAVDARGLPIAVGDVLTGRRGWIVRGYGCSGGSR